MKKIMYLFPLLAVSCLAGCAPKSDSNTVNFMVYQPSRIEHQTALKNLIKSFTDETGIKVNLNMVAKDKYDSQFSNALARGSYKPDIAYLDQPSIAKYAGAENGIIAINDLVSQSQTIDLEKFNQAVLNTNYIGSNLYGLPLNMTASVLFYNKDLVQEKDLPSTWEQWKSIEVPSGKALFEGIGTEGYAGWYFQAFLKNCGGELYDETLNKCTFNTTQGREAAQFLVDIYRNSTDHTIRDASNSFINGDILFKIGSSYDIDNIRKQNPAFNTKLGAILMPSKDGTNHYSVMGGENLVITKVSSKKEKAMQLMEFLLTKDASTLLGSFTGNFPAITEYATTDDPVKQVVLNQLSSVVARPKVKTWKYINDYYLGKALDQILDWEAPQGIEDRLSWAETQANKNL